MTKDQDPPSPTSKTGTDTTSADAPLGRSPDPSPDPAHDPAHGQSPTAPRQRRPLLRVLRSLRGRRNGDDLRDTIEELIDEHPGSENSIADDERQLLLNILDLHDLTVHDVMVPRVDIVAADVTTGLSALVNAMNEAAHSRLPVYRDNLDDTLGMVHIKDVLPYWGSRRVFRLDKVVREVLFAAPSMPVLDLLAQMRDTRIHLALVADEYGGVDGLVTIEDLVEEIVGEIEDEHDEQTLPDLIEERAGVAIADARVTVEIFEDRYGAILTDEEREDIETLGGLVFDLAHRVPARGELIRHSSGVEFQVLDADPRRIRKLRLRNLPRARRPTAQ